MVAGKVPALVFVVRHGARLDAADKEWHLTSPTPYDPPLTYGGWTQCRALGARIASILLAREAAYLNEEAISDPSDTGTTSSSDGQSRKPKRKKHRVFLHSSPFLRCTQTSIAIAAGMSQFHGMQNELRAHHRQSPPRTRTTKQWDSGSKTSTRESQKASTITPPESLPIKPFPKTKLRLDAFLGEWFSPEYYEHITHPPDSILMLAAAKAELLHRGEPLEGVEDSTEASLKPNFFPGGWGSPSAQPNTPELEGKGKELELPDLDRLTVSRSPIRDRATTLGSPVDQRQSATMFSKSSIGGYTPPTPRYAILPTDQIPRGYTAHAREACVDVDYTWDSTRPPQNWGDGGEYGEEWSSMHKRFRSGISRMVNWYRLHHESPLLSYGHKRALHPVAEEETDEDCEVDTVLILVTHGAGCNALIGALTDQPVLMDIAMASLTMAVRKEFDPEAEELSRSPTSPARFLSSDGPPLSDEYSVRITASVDHLHAGTNLLSIPILQNPLLAYKSLFSGRPIQRKTAQPYIPVPKYKMNRSTMVTSSPIDQTFQEIPRSAGLKYGGVQRSASAAARSGGTSAPSLWMGSEAGHNVARNSGPPITITQDHKDQPREDSASGKAPLARIDSGQSVDLATSIPESSPAAVQSSTDVENTTTGLWPAPETGSLVKSSPGLWSARITSNIPSGPPNSMPLEVSERSAAAKRRWTFNENRE